MISEGTQANQFNQIWLLLQPKLGDSLLSKLNAVTCPLHISLERQSIPLMGHLLSSLTLLSSL